MKIERLILIPFFGNYIINNVVAAFAAMVPASATPTSNIFTPQYITFVVLALIASAIFAWWFFRGMSHMMLMKWSVIFGIVAFVVSVATTFVSGIAGVVLQTGSVAQAMTVIPRFGPFLWNWSTLIVLGYWLIPAVLIAWFMNRKMSSASTSTM